MIKDINSGKIMIVSDIQGNWEDYVKIKEKFLKLNKEGNADYLVFTGDLIHGYPGYPDKSFEIIEDLMKTSDNFIPLLGNHEFVHIYHIALSKGNIIFTEPFELRILEEREKFINYFMKMNFCIRTKSGVVINHAGGSVYLSGYKEIPGKYKKTLEFLKKYNHEVVINELELITNQYISKKREFGKKYSFNIDTINLGKVHISEEESQKWWASPISTIDDSLYNPWFGRIFLASELGKSWWEIIFNRNELNYKERYFPVSKSFLKEISTDEYNLKFIVSGHLAHPKGYHEVENFQLRLTSSYGADTNKNKAFLILDAENAYKNLEEIKFGINCIY